VREKRRALRTQPRGLVSKVGKILLGPKIEPIDCTVIDMSAGGARLSVQRPQDIPDNLEFLHGTIRRKCCVVWRRGFQVGISYLAGVERSRVGSGLSRPSRGER
jgi:hypothetical protein